MSVTDLATMTVTQALAEAARRLDAAGVPQPQREARLLVTAGLDIPAERLLLDPQRPIAASDLEIVNRLVARRAAREPLAFILGRREFWSLGFAVTRDTLIPRPETETLVEAALALVPDRRVPLRLLDLGTGSGCILLALLSELPMAQGVGVDASLAAIRVARRNAAALGLGRRAGFVVADWGDTLAAGFDLILANPPYVPDADIDRLEPEIRHYEPRAALSGGTDGLACYRRLGPSLAGLLRPTGHAVIELGTGQAGPIARLMAGMKLLQTGQRMDLAGISRCLIMRPATA